MGSKRAAMAEINSLESSHQIEIKKFEGLCWSVLFKLIYNVRHELDREF